MLYTKATIRYQEARCRIVESSNVQHNPPTRIFIKSICLSLMCISFKRRLSYVIVMTRDASKKCTRFRLTWLSRTHRQKRSETILGKRVWRWSVHDLVLGNLSRNEPLNPALPSACATIFHSRRQWRLYIKYIWIKGRSVRQMMSKHITHRHIFTKTNSDKMPSD